MTTLTQLINNLGNLSYNSKEIFIAKVFASLRTAQLLDYGVYNTTTNQWAEPQVTTDFVSVIHDMYYSHGIGHLILKNRSNS